MHADLLMTYQTLSSVYFFEVIHVRPIQSLPYDVPDAFERLLL